VKESTEVTQSSSGAVHAPILDALMILPVGSDMPRMCNAARGSDRQTFGGGGCDGEEVGAQHGPLIFYKGRHPPTSSSDGGRAFLPLSYL
jgi:hypothetical protein